MPKLFPRLILAAFAALYLWPDSMAFAYKRRPNGCDWIGGDFADPATSIFHTGCGGGRRIRRHVTRLAPVRDEPPKPLDRAEADAPQNFGASARKLVGNGIEGFQIAGGTIAYALNGGGHLWRSVLGTPGSTQVGQSVARFRATDDGWLFVLEQDGTLWRSKPDGSERTFIDHEVTDFQPSGDLVYVASKDKTLWRLHADGKSRDLVDHNVAAFQVAGTGLIFVLDAGGALWRETGDFHGRILVGQPISAFEYIAEGDTAYVLTPNHVLWRKTGTGAPQQVDHDVAAFHAVDQNLVYVLATDGRLWQEFGDRSQALLTDSDLGLKLGPGAFQFVSKGDVEDQAIYVLDRKNQLWAETMPAAHGADKPRAAGKDRASDQSTYRNP